MNELTEEEIAQLMELGIIPEELQQAQADMALANRRKTTPMPKGRNVRGNIYVAANPLEFLGAGMERYRGQQEMDKARQLAEALRRKQVAGRGVYWNAYNNRGGM